MEYDVPDASDWLGTALAPFAALETALHCQVCKEFYDTPMLTSCAHTFCSRCIRTCLSADGRCPACRAADQASKLRNNWALQEIVASFRAARPDALSVARREREAAERMARPGKRKRGALEDGVGGERDGEHRATRSRSKRIAASQASQTGSIEVADSDGEDADFEPEPDPVEADDGLVECPLGCGKRMKIEAVEPHLDRCEDERKQKERRSGSRTPGLGNSHISLAQQAASATKRERLAGLNYSLLNDTKLGRKLKELGVPAWGNRQLMIKRHTEWINLWNANCDSNQPRTKRELLQELDTWERTQGGRAPGTNSIGSAVMRKDFDGAGWASRNRNDFTRLIADARRSKNKPGSESPNNDNSKTPANGDDTVNGDDPVDSGENVNGGDSADNNDKVNGDSRAEGDMGSRGSPRSPTKSAPYADDPVALASLHDTVAAVKAGKRIEPVMNEAFKPLHPTEDAAGDPSSQGQLRDEHASRQRTGSACDLPVHFADSAHSPPSRKVPMFKASQSNLDQHGGSEARFGAEMGDCGDDITM